MSKKNRTVTSAMEKMYAYAYMAPGEKLNDSDDPYEVWQTKADNRILQGKRSELRAAFLKHGLKIEEQATKMFVDRTVDTSDKAKMIEVGSQNFLKLVNALQKNEVVSN